MWLLSVSGEESGRYCWTVRDVNTGHVKNGLLLMDFIMVCFGRLNASWWRYLINAASKFMESALLAWCSVSLVSVVGIAVLGFCKGKTNSRVHS